MGNKKHPAAKAAKKSPAMMLVPSPPSGIFTVLSGRTVVVDDSFMVFFLANVEDTRGALATLSALSCCAIFLIFPTQGFKAVISKRRIK